MRAERGKAGAFGTGNTGTRILALVWLLLVAGFARPLIANSYVWHGNVNSNWFEAGNWEPAAIPGPGADVTVDGTILLTNETAELASFTMIGGTMTFQGWDSALTATTEMTIAGTLTHAAQTATSTNGNGQWIPDSRILLVGGNVTISETGQLDADALGYGPERGPGAAKSRSGAGYGGIGGKGWRAGSPGLTYGCAFEPADPGSGGGNEGGSGGAGGGAIRIMASGILTIDGTITANGGTGDGSSGGGSGGGIWLTASQISGHGDIFADGNSGGGVYRRGESGGGGRIAFDTALNNFSGTIRARSNPASFLVGGRSGTFSFASDPDKDLIIEHDIALPPGTNWVFRSLTVRNEAIFEIQSEPGTEAQNYTNDIATKIRFEKDVMIEENASLSAEGLGYPAGEGEGSVDVTGRAGAGYGGLGGSRPGDEPGATYGSAQSPDRLGSGARRGSEYFGGTGGGALILYAAGTLTVNGTITANGTRGQHDLGGGSGGSVWIAASRIAGHGNIFSEGGRGGGNWPGGCGGGGGRIQLDIGWFDYIARRASQVNVWENPPEWPEPLDFTGDISAAGGPDGGANSTEGNDGSVSIRYLPFPQAGTVFRIF